MSGTSWASIIWLLGALVLAVSAFQGHRIGKSKMLVMVLAWIAVFLVAAGIFAAIGGGSPSPGAS